MHCCNNLPFISVSAVVFREGSSWMIFFHLSARRWMSAQNSTLTSFPGGPSRPAGPVAPGSPCNSAKKKRYQLKVKGRTVTPLQVVWGFNWAQWGISKDNKNLVYHMWHTAFKKNSEASSDSDAQGSTVLSSRIFIAASVVTKTNQHTHSIGTTVMKKRWAAPALDCSAKVLQAKYFPSPWRISIK